MMTQSWQRSIEHVGRPVILRGGIEHSTDGNGCHVFRAKTQKSDRHFRRAAESALSSCWRSHALHLHWKDNVCMLRSMFRSQIGAEGIVRIDDDPGGSGMSLITAKFRLSKIPLFDRIPGFRKTIEKRIKNDAERMTREVIYELSRNRMRGVA